jgi:hypothetical protein
MPHAKHSTWRNLEAMVKSGLTVTDAAKRLGVSTAGYYRYKRYGVVVRTKQRWQRRNGPLGPKADAWWAETLRDLRWRKRLSIRTVAKRSGYTEESISLWERGVCVPTVEALSDVLTVYGMKLEATERNAEDD